MSEMFPPFPSKTMAVVIDAKSVYILSPLNDVDGLALLGCSAEDPASWEDVAMLWPRCKFHEENAEFFDSMPMRLANLNDAISSLDDADAWFALDLIQRRMLTGGKFPQLRFRGTFVDEEGPVTHPILLPPWWELRQGVGPVALGGSRDNPLRIPDPRRDVLWGEAMTSYFAERMLKAIHEGKPWIGESWDGQPCGAFEITVEIHRDWLMTPRKDLGGSIPRERLHGGTKWINDLADCQTLRLYVGQEPVPIPAELSTYPQAAMGRHELIMYFEACRETIGAGWLWMLEDPRRIESSDAWRNLSDAMRRFLAEWLEGPFEGGRPPAEIIRCERLRIPLVDDGSHVIDCDCPICETMASGMFGPSVSLYDGHELEVDCEFAFSIHATRQEWEAEQLEWNEITDRIDTVPHSSDVKETADDPFQSAWKSGVINEAGIPGDKFGHLGMAFLVAELIDSLHSVGADRSDVDLLNAAFREYRAASQSEEHASSAARFQRTLEQLAAKHPILISRAAELQSRIDENLRTAMIDDRNARFAKGE